MSKAKQTAIEQVHETYGSPEPWIIALAEAVDGSSRNKVAKRIGYSSSVVSQVLAGKYPGDINKVHAHVEAKITAARVLCPVAGEIPLENCLSMRPSTSSNLGRMLAVACPDCAHNERKNR